MATKEKEANLQDQLTVVGEAEDKSWKGPTVDVFIPEQEGSGSGMAVDQYEHVTIANEDSESHYKIHRGEYNPIPVPAYLALKAKYPKL